MKKTIVILIMLLWMVNAVRASILIDIPLDPPYIGIKVVELIDEYQIIDEGWADVLVISGNSDITINDGRFGVLLVGGNSSVDIYGGKISRTMTSDLGYIKFYAYDFTFVGNHVSRYDINGGVNRTKMLGGTYDFEIVPEPITLTLLGIGSIFMLRRSNFNGK